MPRKKNVLLSVSKNTVSLLAGRVANMALTFVFIIAAARYLGVDGFGKYALVLHYFELFLSLIATGLGILITREISKAPNLATQYLVSATILVTLLTVLATVVLALISVCSGYALDTRVAIFISCAALWPAAINVILEATYVAYETAEYVTVVTTLESLVRIGLGLGLLYLGYGLISLFVVLILSRTITLLFYVAFLPKPSAGDGWIPGKSFFKKMCRQWRVFAAENWLSNLSSGLGVIVLSIIHGEAAVGLFVAAGRITRLGKLVAESYTTAIFPLLSRLFVESRPAFHRLQQRSLNYMLAFILPFIVGVSILADRVIIFLYTDEYAASIPILRILVWVLLFQFVNPFLSHVLFARNRQRESFAVATIKLVCYAAACLLLIPAWGGIGAAWSSLLSGMIATCFYYYFATRGDDNAPSRGMFARTLWATCAFATLVFALRDLDLLLLLMIGIVLYVALLFTFGIVSTADLRSLMRQLNPNTVQSTND